MQTQRWQQASRKQIRAEHWQNMADREINGSQAEKRNAFNMDHLPYLVYDLPRRSPCKLDTVQAFYNNVERQCKH
jgi:hypothetical protein